MNEERPCIDVAIPTLVENGAFKAAWAEQNWSTLAGWFCPVATEAEPWLNFWACGIWKEHARSFVDRSIALDDVQPLDLMILARLVWQRLWEEGIGPQPTWWRDFIVPTILELMNKEPYDNFDEDEKVAFAILNLNVQWPEGWHDLENWLQAWVNGLLSFYEVYSRARREGDRLGFYMPYEEGYRPAAYSLLTLRLLRRALEARLWDLNAGEESICFIRKFCGWIGNKAVEWKKGEIDEGIGSQFAINTYLLINFLAGVDNSNDSCPIKVDLITGEEIITENIGSLRDEISPYFT